MLTVLKAFVVLAVCLSSAPAVALAAPPVSCPPGQTPDPNTGICVLVAEPPPGPDGPEGPGQPGGDDIVQPASRATCTDTSRSPAVEVPCSGENGWWVQSRQCYAKAANPQPPKSDPLWEGHDFGAIYGCTRAFDTTVAPVVVSFWAGAAPGVGAPPDPADLARKAIAQMNLRAVSIGIVPEPGPNRIGLVGLPTWMWAQDAAGSSWGPVTRKVTAGAYSVTATAKVAKVVWAMGDGSTVVCRTPGTPYEDRFGASQSPDCGHQYTKQGRYTVRATSHWSVAWAGIGQSGTIPLTLADSAVITMGEAQVLTQ